MFQLLLQPQEFVSSLLDDWLSPPARFPLLRVYLFVSETGKSLSAKSQLLERARWILSLTPSSCAGPDIREAPTTLILSKFIRVTIKEAVYHKHSQEVVKNITDIYLSWTLLHVIMTIKTFWSEGLFLNCRQSLLGFTQYITKMFYCT